MSMYPPTRGELEEHDDLQELHALVPKDTWLAVSEQEMPHRSRLNMLSLRDTTNAAYLLYGVGSGGLGGDNGERVLAAGEFELVAERPGLGLVKRRPGDDIPRCTRRRRRARSRSWTGPGTTGARCARSGSWGRTTTPAARTRAGR
jgi:hypothetical protein